MANVDITISIWRAIMQDELGTTQAGGAYFFIALLCQPLGEHLRFALGQIATHGERRIGKIKSFFIINHVV